MSDFLREYRRLGWADLHESREQCVRAATKSVSVDGLWLEFGVGGGLSASWISERAPLLYGFDHFKGLPDQWYGCPQGSFAQDALPPVPSNVELVLGDFADTVQLFLEHHPEPVAFAHIDCDLYASAKVVLTAILPRLVPGSIIEFDELHGHEACEQHEMRAWLEVAGGLNYAYRGRCRDYQAFLEVLNA